MITLIRPILFSFIQSEKVKMLVVDLLSKMAESTDNTVDDQMVNSFATVYFQLNDNVG